MIICGFPGVGKSFMARNMGCVDLESTPFERDWMTYARVAAHMDDNGYNVMVSTHPEMLDTLVWLGKPHVVVIPPITDKDEYIQRYRRRGSSEEFIKLLDENFVRWIQEILEKSVTLRHVVILPRRGTLMDFHEMCLRHVDPLLARKEK